MTKRFCDKYYTYPWMSWDTDKGGKPYGVYQCRMRPNHRGDCEPIHAELVERYVDSLEDWLGLSQGVEEMI